MLSPYIYLLMCEWNKAAALYVSLGISNNLAHVKACIWGHAHFHKALRALIFLAKIYVDTDHTLMSWVFHLGSCNLELLNFSAGIMVHAVYNLSIVFIV